VNESDKIRGDTDVVADLSILLKVDPDSPNVHTVGIKGRRYLGDLFRIRFALIPRPIAWEPVRIDVGVSRSSGIVVRGNKVGVDCTPRVTSFVVAADDGLGKALAFGFGPCGLGDECRRVDRVDERVCGSDKSREQKD
jgi:hypothetical protein